MVWVIMRRRGYPQNAGVLVVLVSFEEIILKDQGCICLVNTMGSELGDTWNQGISSYGFDLALLEYFVMVKSVLSLKLKEIETF